MDIHAELNLYPDDDFDVNDDGLIEESDLTSSNDEYGTEEDEDSYDDF